MTADRDADDDSESDVRDRYRRRTALGTMAIGLFAGCLNLREESEQGDQSDGNATEPTTETDDQPDGPTLETAPAYGLEERWRAALETGTITDIAQAGRDGPLFVGGGDSATVARLSPSSGTRRWTRSLEAPLANGRAIEPSPSGDVIAAATESGTVRLLDADDGAPLWDSTATHTASISLSVGSESVIVLSDTTDDEGGAVTAFDRTTGRLEWRNTKDDFLEIDDSPVLLSSASAPIDGWVFVAGWNGSYRISIDDGTIDDEEFRAASNGWTIDGDRLYMASMEGINAVDLPAFDRRWRAESLGRANRRPTVAGDAVYFAAENDGYYAVDAETGDRNWRARFVAAGRAPLEPAVTAETVWVTDREQSVYGLDRATGELDGVQEFETEHASVEELRERRDAILVLVSGELSAFELP
ncbi:PQQ-binding-like beta-propeller repeat protein [Natrinema versiforme]|uniref:Serine/threonine protein kinase n=1 Tax=Natrinema versiforme JCM 10478 TaxID=1227496 RepID=L9Y7Q4_9EURY|nr:PQQ-binding-like beta-propeller repeat protein [Natrinema versiforme]ELY70059.1 serine/threonine protein kinase [Natrinema versiforme JCM 10478]